MAGSQVADVNVVAYAGAVRGIVVVAKDMNGLSLANGGLSHVRNEVVGNACRIFADKAGLVRANGIEVAEQDNVPCGICGMHVGEDLLDHPFCPAVWVGRRLFRAFFSQGQRVRIAIDGCRAGEDDGFAIVCAHHVQQGERGAEVIGVVLNRLSNGFSNGLEARKMNNAVDMVRIKDTIELRAIVDIGFVKRQTRGVLLAHNGFNAVDDFF